jgi:hypothetical protein
MPTIFAFFLRLIERLFPERDTLENYLSGAQSLEEIEYRQQQWDRYHGHPMMYR